MSGVRLEISIDDGGLGRALERAIAAGTDLRPALEGSALIIEGSVQRRFDTGQGPGGIPWPPSRRALEQGGKTLVDKGSLRESITHDIGANQVDVGVQSPSPGNADKYAAAHQFGAHIVPRNGEFLVFTGSDGGLVFLRSVDLPARPFVGFDDQDVADLEDLWTSHIEEAFDGN